MSEALTVDVRPEHGALRLRLAGDLDISTVDTLRACLEAIDDGVRRVILDLSDLEFLDSSGLNLFVHTHRRFGPELRELTIAHPRPSTRRVLEVSGLDHLIPMTGERREVELSEPV